MTDKLYALRWRGGKSAQSPARVGEWINAMLPPPDHQQTYCEPFAGMLGVLLQRRPAPREVVNDLDGRIINFWRVLRDTPDELNQMLEATPYSRDVYQEAHDVLADPDSDGTVKQAWAFVTAVGQSMLATPDSAWQLDTGYKADNKTIAYRPAENFHNACARLTSQRMRARIKNVILENKDGIKIVNELSGFPQAVIYIDPPYASSTNKQSYSEDVDHEALKAACATSKSKIAISGYRDCPYDDLGWIRHEKPVSLTIGMNPLANDRIECLWTNFEPSQTTQAELW